MHIQSTYTGFLKKNKLYLTLIILLLIFNYIADSSWGTKAPGLIFEAGEIVEWQNELPSEEAVKELIFEGNIYALGLFGVTFLLILGFISGIIIDTIYFFLHLQSKNVIPRLDDKKQIPWNLLDVIRVIILYFSFLALIKILFITGFVYSLISFIFRFNNSIIVIDSFENMALGFSLSYLIIVLILAYFIINKYKQSFFEALGVNVKSFIKGVILGLASYVSYLPFLFIALLISLGISSFFKMAPEENPLLNVFSIEGRPWLLFYFVLCICIIGPIVEELFFRGFLYPALRKKVGSILSIFLSAALFSLLHMTFVGFLPIFFLGILLAYIYEKSGSLLPSITIHIIHNSSITLFLLIIKGLGS
jgi:hypothetical protein